MAEIEIPVLFYEYLSNKGEPSKVLAELIENELKQRKTISC